jgi:hypothetical protein
MIVHRMDPPNIFPYKGPQMAKVFGAFEAMLRSKAVRRNVDDAPLQPRIGR